MTSLGILSQLDGFESFESKHTVRLGTLVGLVRLLVDGRFLSAVSADSISLSDEDEC